MMPKISIILPVYNAEKTVSHIIDSIIVQTFEDWELLIVNDGSTDDSRVIIDEYAENDPRIRVFHKENGGVATARQVGVNHARGIYSIHADSDDWVEPTMLEELYCTAVEKDADIVIADYILEKDGKSTICIQRPGSYDPKEIMYEILTGRLFGALWNKLLRTSLYKAYDAKFFEGINYSEDVLLLSQILRNTTVKVSYHAKGYYHYFLNSESITNRMSKATYDGLKNYYAILSGILPDDERFQQIKQTFPLGLFTTGFTNGFYSRKETRQRFQEVRNIAYTTKSIRWLIGYLCIDLGLYSIARKLVKY